ncbi:MAG: Ig-like domain-containing protein [Ruminococcus sp.]|nr:Ig-like domain-containing protein [Ruminococcus sp.]
MKVKKLICTACCAAMLLNSASLLPQDMMSDLIITADASSITEGSISAADINSGKAVSLPSTVLNYSTSDAYQIEYNSSHNGIYFCTANYSNMTVNLLSLEDGSYKTVFDSSTYDFKQYVDSSIPRLYNQYESSYVQGSKLYMLFNEYYYVNNQMTYISFVLVYDFDKQEIVSSTKLDKDYGKHSSAIGADSTGRVYLVSGETIESTDSEGNTTSTIQYYVDLYDSSYNQLDSTEVAGRIFRFTGFDSTNGNFYFETYYNWRYWGYDHALYAMGRGNVTDNKVTTSKSLIQTIGQRYYSTFSKHSDLVGGKYLCIDAPLNVSSNLMNPYSSGLTVFDSAKIDSDGALLMNISHSYPSYNSSFDTSAIFGPRTVASPVNSNNIVTVTDLSTLTEYEAAASTVVGSIDTEHPVFSLINGGNSIIAIERERDENGTSFYIQKFPWKASTKLTMNAPTVSLSSDSFYQLTANSDGTLSESITWSSSDPTVASVDENGKVYAYRQGSAVITAAAQSGKSCTSTVTVKNSAVNSAHGSIVHTTGSETSTNTLSTYSHPYWSTTVKSYINEEANGNITRLEYLTSADKVIAETYSSDCKTLRSTKTITKELPIFGGAFFGVDNNYIVFGQQNTEESEEAEVLRIVKYTKDWTRVSALSVNGANTYIPFDAGSLRMIEVNGLLYIHTCHEMFNTGDGLHHQANMTYVVNESDMTMNQCYYDVMNLAQAGYVSHSFNQFIRTDGEYIYRVDHGDASPRGVPITLCDVGGDITKVGYIIPIKFSNSSKYNYNYTGAALGGFELSENNMLILGCSTPWDNIDTSQYNVFLNVTHKDYYGVPDNTKTIWLTEYGTDDKVFIGTPHLTKLNEDSFLITWEETTTVGGTVTKAVTVDGRGDLTSEISTLNVRLSDCEPVLCSDGMVKWYVTSNSAPVFYSLNTFEPTLIDNDEIELTVKLNSDDYDTSWPVTAEISGKTGVINSVNGKVTIPSLADGTYTIKFSAANFVTRTYNITVKGGKITENLTPSLNLKGDINGDGKLNASDLLLAKSHIKRVSLLKDYQFACADIDNSKTVNASDLLKMKSHIKKVSLLW